jgi:hypothetical protein
LGYHRSEDLLGIFVPALKEFWRGKCRKNYDLKLKALPIFYKSNKHETTTGFLKSLNQFCWQQSFLSDMMSSIRKISPLIFKLFALNTFR